MHLLFWELLVILSLQEDNLGKGHYWVTKENSGKGDVIEIIVKDYTGAKIESWTMNINDKKTSKKVMGILRRQYGFKPEILSEKSMISEDKDLKWLKETANPFNK